MSAPPIGPRRIAKGKIKPPRQHAQPGDDTWLRLAKAIKEIQNKNASKLRFEEQYRYAYQLVIHKKGNELYENFKALVREHLENQVKERIVPVFTNSQQSSTTAVSSTASTSASDTLTLLQTSEAILLAVKDVWNDHLTCMSKICAVLQYMDKVYVKPPTLSSYSLGITIFLSAVVNNTTYPVKEHLINALLDLIRLERQGEAVNRSAIYSCTDMLSGLREGDLDFEKSAYQIEFESKFLEQTRTFYENEVSEILTNGTATEYLAKVERRLGEEKERVRHYLNSGTETLLISLLDQILITDQAETVIKHERRGLDTLMEESNFTDLGRMYSLCHRVHDADKKLHQAVYDWIVKSSSILMESLNKQQQLQQELSEEKQKTKEKQEETSTSMSTPSEQKQQQTKKSSANNSSINTSTQTAIDWASKLLQLKAKLDAILHDSFQSERQMHVSISEALSKVANQNNRAPEFISLFLDDNLRRGFKGKTEDEVESILVEAVVLFRLLADKDVFERYYKNHLAKRLLQGKSVSDDAERSLLAKLKVECGSSFVRDLEGMLRDVKLSQDTTSKFKADVIKTDKRPPIDLTVQICTSSFWPIQNKRDKQPCQFPQEFVQTIQSFETFYHKRHSGRKLVWHPEYGSVDVKVQFKARSHEINLSTFGMIVLCLFENLGEDEQLSYEDLITGTRIPENDLNRTLQSLACAKYKILTKEPKGRDINKTDKFSFNHSFTCPLARIKIQTVANKVETNTEREKTGKKTEEERKLVIEACAVRVMKTRKFMMYPELVNEVVSLLTPRFPPQPAMIKMGIDRLIEQEYLERDAADRKKLHYLA